MKASVSIKSKTAAEKARTPTGSSGRKVIALLFRSYDREVDIYKTGILQYARPARDWAFIHCSQKNIENDLRRTDGFFHGGIGEFGRPDLWAAARQAKFPVVNLHGGRGFCGVPKVGVDDRAIGRMAAEYFLGQGHRNFAFFGLSGRGFSLGRWAGFALTLRRNGFRAQRYKGFKQYPDPGLQPLLYVPNEMSIAGWLSELPRPCAVFCCDDLRASWLSMVCHNLGLHVPEKISLLGVDDDDVHCTAALPHLSSIRLPARKAGYEAARLLDQLMGGTAPPTLPDLLLPPEILVVRETTDLIATDDPQLVKALQCIRKDAPRGRLSVDAVVKRTSYCRRILENKFKKNFGRTIFQEIRHHQIEHAKKLLRETPDTMESIADATGWSSASHFGIEFKKLAGVSPGEYRRSLR